MLIDIGWSDKYLDRDVEQLYQTLKKYDITGRKELAMFLTQCIVESKSGMAKVEDGDEEYLESLYSGKNGNKSEEDALKYSGGGCLQLTGKRNYQEYSDYLKKHGRYDPEVMEKGRLCLAEKYPWDAAGFWWYRYDMKGRMKRGATVEDISRAVNNGPYAEKDKKPSQLETRQEKFEIIYKEVGNYELV